MIGVQCAPASVDLYIASPQNEAYSTDGVPGSMAMSVAPRNWSVVPLRRVQVAPPSVDSYTPYTVEVGGVTRRMPLRPRPIAMYRWLALVGSTASPAVATPRNAVPLTLAQVTPPSVDFIT